MDVRIIIVNKNMTDRIIFHDRINLALFFNDRRPMVRRARLF